MDFSDPDIINLNKVHPIRDLDGTTTAQDIDDNFDHLVRALRAIKELIDELQVGVNEIEDTAGDTRVTKPVTIIHTTEDHIDPWPMFAPSSGGTAEVTGDLIETLGYWAPLTDGDVDATEFIFAGGECIMVWIDTP
jgi:hypothetical protein